MLLLSFKLFTMFHFAYCFAIMFSSHFLSLRKDLMLLRRRSTEAMEKMKFYLWDILYVWKAMHPKIRIIQDHSQAKSRSLQNRILMLHPGTGIHSHLLYPTPPNLLLLPTVLLAHITSYVSYYNLLTNTTLRPFNVQPKNLHSSTLILIRPLLILASTPFPFFHRLHAFSWTTGCDQLQGPIKLFPFGWFIILPDHPLSSFTYFFTLCASP